MKLTDEQIIKACGVVCGDNRFELIKKYKQMLFEQTNIETAKDQVAVIDGILFRFWQMGWLDKLEEFDRQKADYQQETERLAHYMKMLDYSIEERNKLWAENKRFKSVLMGVMHSVDKWLDGDELKQDETNRAATMREKTLQIVEKQQAEINRFHVEVIKLNAEKGIISTVANMRTKELEALKNKAVKEFAKEHRKIIMAFCDDDDQISLKVCEYDANTNNLVKEMAGE